MSNQLSFGTRSTRVGETWAAKKSFRCMAVSSFHGGVFRYGVSTRSKTRVPWAMPEGKWPKARARASPKAMLSIWPSHRRSCGSLPAGVCGRESESHAHGKCRARSKVCMAAKLKLINELININQLVIPKCTNVKRNGAKRIQRTEPWAFNPRGL